MIIPQKVQEALERYDVHVGPLVNLESPFDDDGLLLVRAHAGEIITDIPAPEDAVSMPWAEMPFTVVYGNVRSPGSLTTWGACVYSQLHEDFRPVHLYRLSSSFQGYLLEDRS